MRSARELRLRERAGPVLRKIEPLLLLSAYVWRRMLFRTTFIGITGSLGKTTAKETLANILSRQGRTFRSFRNQNTTPAVALNILRVRPWHRYAVIEVAGAAPGMVRRSARILSPDVVLLLNVRRTHTDKFSTPEIYAGEKAELVAAVRRGGLAVLNGDDPLLAGIAAPRDARVQRFGQNAAVDFRLSDASSTWPNRLEFNLHRSSTTHRVVTQLIGTQWTVSVTGAATVGMSMGIDPEVVLAGIKDTQPFDARLQPVELPSGAIMIRDDYSASADSIEPSIRLLRESTAKRRVLVISDVSDLGLNSRKRMRYLAGLAASAADAVVFVGQEADYAARRAIEAGMDPAGARGFASIKTAAEFLRGDLREGDLVLLKGRTTDHITRIFHSQLGQVACWLEHCPKTMLCDSCWKLGFVKVQNKQESLPTA